MENNFLFFDIDGTLIDPKTHQIPLSAIDGIRQAGKKGNLVFICSGRGYFEVKESFGFQPDGIIFTSGAGFELNGKIVLKRVFDQTLATSIMEMADQCKIGCNFLCFERGYANEAWRNYWFQKVEDLPIVERNEAMIHPFYLVGCLPYQKYLGEDVFKINVHYFEDSDIQTFEAFIFNKVTYVPANSQDLKSYGAEISPIDVNKGTGVLMVTTHFHGKMENTYGFGDSLNDIDMIRECGHGIAMGNAKAALKEQADYVTDDVDKDGILKALKHYNLC